MNLWSCLTTAAYYSSGILLSFHPSDKTSPFKRRKYSSIVTLLVIIILISYGYYMLLAYMDEANNFLYGRRRTKGMFDTPVFYGLTHIFVFLSAIVSLVRFHTADTLGLLNQSVVLCSLDVEHIGRVFLNKYLLYTAFAICISVSCAESFLTLSSSWREGYIAACVTVLTVITRLPAFAALSLFYILLVSVDYKLRSMKHTLLKTYAVETLQPKSFLPSVEQSFRNSSHLFDEIKETRVLHKKLNNFSQTVMSRFQYDIMFLIMYSFYSCITSSYNVVTNLQYAFKDTASTTIFVFLSIMIICGNGILLVISCRGPCIVRSQVASFLSLVSMAKNKSETSLDTRFQNEVRFLLLQCQVARKNRFVVSGMFDLNNAFLFMVSTTIVSYVIVLVQFAE